MGNYRFFDNLENMTSEYLCSECGKPLYIASAFLAGEYCLTGDCANALPGGISVVDTSDSANPKLMRELEQRKQELLDEMSGWDQQELARALARTRRDVFRGAVVNGYMSGQDILRVGELIRYYNQVEFRDRPVGPKYPGTVVRMIDRIIEIENFLDNCDTGRYVMVRSAIMSHENDGLIPLYLKYSVAHNADMRSSGMTHTLPVGPAQEMFTFEEIDFQEFGVESGKGEDDMVRRLEHFLPTSFQLDRTFRHNYRTAIQYNYPWNPFAASVIAGWWVTCADPDVIYTETDKDLASTLDKHFKKYGEKAFTGEDFVETYIDSTDFVPLGIRSPNGVLMDRWSLFFMLIYLYGRPVPKEYQDQAGYSSSLNQFMTLRGQVFDDWLKEKLSERNLRVPIVNRTFTADGRSFEYDLVAVSEKSKKIWLAEDKYRDIPPSSVTGVNLIAQEVESASGAMATAVRQRKRVGFFNEHPNLFESELDLENDLSSYDIEGVIITKSSPVLSSYEGIRFVEVTDFLDEIGE